MRRRILKTAAEGGLRGRLEANSQLVVNLPGRRTRYPRAVARPKRSGFRGSPPSSIAIAVPRGRKAAITDWRLDTTVVSLTEKVRGLLSGNARRSADAVAKIGAHLARIRDRLPHGQWLQWIDDNAPFSRGTATNYIELAAWATREPRDFARLRHLGPAKLYVIASAEPQRVKGLKPGKLVALGDGRRKTIEDLTTPELVQVVIGGLKGAEDGDEVPIEKVVQGIRFKVAGLRAAAEVFVGRVDEVGVEVVRGVREDLVAVLGVLEGGLE